MIRVSELLKSIANNLDRIVILDHGNLYPFSNKTMPGLNQYARRGVNSFYIEAMFFENRSDLDRALIVKQTVFIELKGDTKNDQM